MGDSVDLSSLSGVWLGRLFTIYNELSWRLRWTLSVDCAGHITGQHFAVSPVSKARRTGAIVGCVIAREGAPLTLKLAYRDDQNWVFVHELIGSNDGGPERFEGRNELTSSESDDAATELFEASRTLRGDDLLCDTEAGLRYEWFDSGRTVLRRENQVDIERTRARSAVRAALRERLPAGAKAKRSVVGQKRVEGSSLWEAYTRIEYVAAGAKKPRDLSFSARGPTGRDALETLLAKLTKTVHSTLER